MGFANSNLQADKSNIIMAEVSMKKYWDKTKSIIKTTVQFFLNPRLLLCLGIAWMITNGWSYILMGIGVVWDIPWMIWVASGYLALLWVPFTPEKIITAVIAIFFLKMLFPDDQKTLQKLRNIKEKAKAATKKLKTKRKQKRDKN